MASKKDRKRRGGRKRLRDWLTVRVALAVAAVVPRMRLETLQRLGGFLGRVAARLPGKRKERVRQHLEIAFPPGEHAADTRERLLVPAYVQTVRIFLEALWGSAWDPARDDQRVVVEGGENLQRTIDLARERGTGIVYFTAHLGTPEAMNRWFVDHCGAPLMAVAARPKIPELVAPMVARREFAGMKLVFRGDAGLATIRHMKRGGALLMLVDHNMKGPGVEIPFFGKGAHTLLAPARLALQTGAVATTIFGLRDGIGRFRVVCDEPMLMPEPAKDPEERFRQEAALAREYTRRIEEAIRRHPDQYLWMHKRWQKRSDTLPYPLS
jgi:KDO2-lipid IV(A) lauroyltransferase